MEMGDVFEKDGIKLIAQDSINGACFGCQAVQYCCELACSDRTRSDGRDVIWVKAKKEVKNTSEKSSDDLLTDAMLLLYLIGKSGMLKPVGDVDEYCYYSKQIKTLVNTHCLETGKKELFK